MRWLGMLVVVGCAAPQVAVPVPVRTAKAVATAPRVVEHEAVPDASYRFRYVAAPTPLLEIAITTAGAEGGTTTFELGEGFAGITDPEVAVRDVAASDARGAPLAVAHPTKHTWRVASAAGQPVTLRYTVTSAQVAGFRERYRPVITEHFVHLVGHHAVMWPADLGDAKRAIRFTWEGLEAAHLQPATSFGSATCVDLVDTFEHFREAVFVASDALRLTTRPAGEGTLELAVTGAWPFSDGELADAIVRIMTAERGFFGDRGPPYFFVHVYPLGAGTGSYGGTGYTHSFDLALSPGFPLDGKLRNVIAHEHFHGWNGAIITPEAFEALTYWFTEGFTSFYAARLVYRAGLGTLEDYVRELDDELAGYLRSPARDAPNARVTGFWDDPDLQKLPYQRGYLVALVADREIRRATGGKLSLDDVMRALVDTGRKGARLTSERALAMIEGLTSAGFAARLRATVLDGAALAIEPSLFEPCLSGALVKTWTYELGFDWAASRPGMKVVGVRPGSPAARAGVRDGEAITGVSMHPGDPDRAIELVLGPDRRKISYLPRGAPLTVPRFTVHDPAACAAVLGPALP